VKDPGVAVEDMLAEMFNHDVLLGAAIGLGLSGSVYCIASGLTLVYSIVTLLGGPQS
jgi:hypothetical protein